MSKLLNRREPGMGGVRALSSAGEGKGGPCSLRSPAAPGKGWAWSAVAALVTLGGMGGSAHALEVEDFLSHDFGWFLAQPQIDVSTAYTDNLTYTQGSDKISDLQGTLSPGLRLRRGDLTGNYFNVEAMHDEMFFLDHSDFNFRQNRFKGNGVYRSARTKLEVAESYEMLSGFLGGIIGQSGVVNTSPRRRDVWTGFIRGTYDWTQRTDVYADFQHYQTDWTKEVFLYDASTMRGAFGGSYEFTERIRFFTEGFYGQSGVTANQVSQLKGVASAFYGGFVGARGQFTERFSGSGKVGVENRSFFEKGRSSLIIPAFNADLRYELTDTLAMSLIYSRLTSPSFNFGGQNATTDSATLSAAKTFGTTGQWMVRAGVTYQRVDYSNSSLAGQPSTARNDDFVSGDLSLNYQPRPWLTASAGYAFEKYDVAFANPLLYLRNLTGYQASRVFVNLSLGF